MCKFFSCIALKNKFVFSPGINSHEDLIDFYQLDDKTQDPDFVRIEFLPPDSKHIINIEKWSLSIDQDLLPKWFTLKKKESLYQALKKFMLSRIIVDNRKLLLNGPWILCKNTNISMVKNVFIYAMCDNSEIGSMCGNSEIGSMHNDSKIVLMRDNSEIELMYDNSVVELMCGNSEIGSMCDNSEIVSNRRSI